MRSKTEKIITCDTTGYVHVPNIIVNIPGRYDHYCEAGFTLAVNKKSSDFLKKNTEYVDVIKASITELLSSYSYEKLLSYDGKMRLKRHIRSRINSDFSSNLIKEVYFRKLLFQ